MDHNPLEQLTNGGSAGAPESYSYDANGNRISSHLSSSHTHDAANRLLEDETFSYTYDANGNLSSRLRKSNNETTTYNWNIQNQLILIDFPDATNATYRYDGLGRRIEKNVNGAITRYVYDGPNILLEYDGSNTLVARYGYGGDIDQPLHMERGGNSFYYHADHLGSIRKLSDGSGLVVNSYEYDSYGRLETSVEGVANPFTYTARESDAESGLYYNRARYYEPQSGRFVSEDPIGFTGGNVNLYAYVSNNPIDFTDPLGLEEEQGLFWDFIDWLSQPAESDPDDAPVDTQNFQDFAGDDTVLGNSSFSRQLRMDDVLEGNAADLRGDPRCDAGVEAGLTGVGLASGGLNPAEAATSLAVSEAVDQATDQEPGFISRVISWIGGLFD